MAAGTAIRKSVRDRCVLDIGTGKDAILARICVEEGARKVYAAELLESSFRQAKALDPLVVGVPSTKGAL